MATESREKPKSNVKRNSALQKAIVKRDAMETAGTNFLTPDTDGKLVYIAPVYKAAIITVNTGEAAQLAATTAMDIAAFKLKRVCSRFITVFGEAVTDEEFPASDFALYHLDSKGNVPLMDTNDRIKSVAEYLVSGESARVALGQTAMSNPPIAKVIILFNIFILAVAAQNAAMAASIAAKQALNGLKTLADEAILMVWNEVETKYGLLPNPALRVQGRLWGISYVRVGSKKIVTGKVTDSVSGSSLDDVLIYFENGNNDATSDATGYSLETTLMDAQVLIATKVGYFDFSLPVTLVENVNPVIPIVMIKKP